MRDYFIYQGFANIAGSRDAIRYAFKHELIHDGENWMKMVDDRIKSVHTYNQETVRSIHENISNIYYKPFLDFLVEMR